MRSVFKLLGVEYRAVVVRDPATVEHIAVALAEAGERARFVASFAYVMARVAHADLEISAEEVEVMRRIVAESSGLPPRQAELIVEIATGRALEFGAHDYYLVTRLFRELSNRDERLALLECLFAVAAADKNISTAENTEISVIAGELGLTPVEVTRVRSLYREHLAVLKGLPGRA